jgi:hypothetical protein
LAKVKMAKHLFREPKNEEILFSISLWNIVMKNGRSTLGHSIISKLLVSCLNSEAKVFNLRGSHDYEGGTRMKETRSQIPTPFTLSFRF